MPAKKTQTILFKLDYIITDRTEYKPYIAQLSGENIFVAVNVPEEEVSSEPKRTVLTVDGLAVVLDKVATAIETMNEQHRLKKFGH